MSSIMKAEHRQTTGRARSRHRHRGCCAHRGAAPRWSTQRGTCSGLSDLSNERVIGAACTHFRARCGNDRFVTKMSRCGIYLAPPRHAWQLASAGTVQSSRSCNSQLASHYSCTDPSHGGCRGSLREYTQGVALSRAVALLMQKNERSCSPTTVYHVSFYQ